MAKKRTKLVGGSASKRQVTAATRAKLSAAQLGSRQLKGMAKKDSDRLKPTKLGDSHGRSGALKATKRTRLAPGKATERGSR
ncbi:hypothetical protein [Embleya sp. NPDC005971]|uniref:hypothetical protein n=1 Tax=Embleya sp. NPDC005971 TaxID=3156724 RepID=UPI0033E64D1F